MLERTRNFLRRPPTFESNLGKRVLGVSMIVFGVLLVILATVRPNPFKSSQTIVAQFGRVHGLGSIDRDVRIGGANVGEIGGETREGDDVFVELKLEPDIRIHQDARVNLRPHTLFEGSAFVDVHPGSPSAPLLEEGEVIPKSRTEVYVSLDEATRLLRKDNREALRDLVGSVHDVFRGEAIEGLRKTLEVAPELMRDLGPTARALRGPKGEELAGAIRGMADTVEAIGSREEKLVPVLRNANRTLAALDVDGGAALDAGLAALPGGLEQLQAGGADLTSLIERLDALAGKLTPGLDELAALLRDSRPLLRRTTPIVEEATPLVAGLRTVLARLADASPALREAIVALRPGARVLQEKVLPALNASSQLGVPVFAQLPASFAGATGALRPFQTLAQNPNGTGHVLRLGSYLDETFLGDSLTPSCASIALIDPNVADQLENVGLCR